MSGNVKTAVIMAAGQGKRLRPITDVVPKAMVQVGGRPLLDRHLEHLEALGVRELIVIVGWKKEAPRALCAGRKNVTVIENPIFDTSGSGYSLALGLRSLGPGHADQDVLFMDADLIYAREFLKPLVDPKDVGNALLVGSGNPDDAEAVKVRGRGGLVVELRKKSGQPGLEFMGESVGITRLSPRGRARLLAWMAEREKSTPDYEWEHAVEGVAPELELRAIKAPALPWTEIDTEADLARAEKILKELEARAK